MAKNSIEIKNLKKIFKRQRSFKNIFFGKSIYTTAVNAISLNIREGEVSGLLGPNGAGKTTLIKMLSTLITPTQGEASVCGYDVVKDEWNVRKIIGLIHSDERSFFWRLTGKQNLEFFAAILQVPKKLTKDRIDEAIAHVGLQEHADNLFHNYSTGMKQRLAIARGLLNRPKILFMDEAMRSIDPISTRKIRELIKTMIREREGITIVMATNRLDEATDLCDRVAILNRGELVKCGSIGDIEEVTKESIQYEIEVRNLTDNVIDRIRKMRWVHECKETFHLNGKVGIVITLDSEEESIHLVLEEIMKGNGYILRCDRREPSFEASFDMIIKEFEGHGGECGL